MHEDTQRKVRINLSLDSELIEKAEALAKRERRSLSNLIEVLIEKENEREEVVVS